MARNPLTRLFQDRRGSIAVEVAAALPVLLLLLLAGVEVTRFVLLNQKLERASATMGDLVSRAETLTETDLASMYEATRMTVEPFDLQGSGTVVVSSISNSGGAVMVNWQRAYGSGGGSAFGTEGGPATLPAGFLVRDGESIITSEVRYDFVPTLAPDVVGPKGLYRYAILRPRFGMLDSLN